MTKICEYCGKVIENPQGSQRFHKKCYKKYEREYNKKYWKEHFPYKGKGYKNQREKLRQSIWRKMQVKAQEYLHPKEIKIPLEFNKILIRDKEK